MFYKYFKIKKKPLLWLLSQIKNRIPALLVMLAAQVGYTLLLVFFALGSRGVIDSATTGNTLLFRTACIKQSCIILGILICLFILRNLRGWLLTVLERDWKQQLLHGLLHGEYTQISAYHSAELINRLNNDVSKVNEGLLSVLPDFVSMAVKLVAAVAVLGILDARFTLLIIVLGLVMIAGTAVLRGKVKQLSKSVSHHDGIVSGFLQEVLEKLLIVQGMGIAEEVERRSDLLLKERYKIQRTKKNVQLFADTSISTAFYGAGYLALIWCSFKMLLGQMSFGSLTAIIQLVNQLQAPFINITGSLPKYIAMIASAERLMELYQIQGEPEKMIDDPDKTYSAMTELGASGLCFSYEQTPVFNNAEFSLPKGAFAVVTGASGIGKSTLLKLLLGIFNPSSGTMYIKHNDEILPLDRSCRPLFAYVPQGNMLFSGTLRDNLSIVKPDASEEEISQAVYVSAMDEYLPLLPMGLDTILGESGAGLSEGQVQRIAIARAVLGGAPILLLDECSSALDEATEKKVLQRLKALENRTCIAVTHRPAAIEMCSWQLEVSDGSIKAVKNDTQARETG